MKESILLIGRGKILQYYIQGMINIFSKNYTVLVIDDQKLQYKGDHIRLKFVLERKEEINYDEIQRIERELNLNLYASYANYFYYGRLAQEANINYSSYWKNKESIAREYLNAYYFFCKLFNKYNIKFIFHDSIDLIYTEVIEALSKKLNIGFYHTLIKPGIFNNRIIISKSRYRINPLFYKNLTSSNFRLKNHEKIFLDDIYKKFSEKKPILSYISNRSQKLITKDEVKSLLTNTKNFKYGIKRFLNRIWLIKQAKNFSIERSKEYILYFMSHQPEATTTSAAWEYVDQWKIIEDIAVHAPSDINVIIKPHPFGYGWYGKNYYEKLLRLPNVFIAPVNYDGKELIENAKAVLTINGSVALEAMIYGIPAYTLGNAWYSHRDYIKNLSKPVDILKELNNLKTLSKEEKDRVLISAYRASVDFFVSYLNKDKDKKIKSGENLADHILKNKNIYFNREIKDYEPKLQDY